MDKVKGINLGEIMDDIDKEYDDLLNDNIDLIKDILKKDIQYGIHRYSMDRVKTKENLEDYLNDLVKSKDKYNYIKREVIRNLDGLFCSKELFISLNSKKEFKSIYETLDYVKNLIENDEIY